MSKAIIVGYDGSEGSTAALTWAAGAASQRGRTLDVLTTWSMPAADLGIGASATLQQDLVDELRKEAQATNDEALEIAAKHGVNATGTIVVGRPASALVNLSEDAEMVVVGSHGSGGLTGYLLGSVSRQVATHAACPSVVVRPTDTSSTNEEPAPPAKVVKKSVFQSVSEPKVLAHVADPSESCS